MKWIRDWSPIVSGTKDYPVLMSFERLSDDERNSFAEQLGARKTPYLSKIKKGNLPPDVLAYEESHRAVANWRFQIDKATSGKGRYRRYRTGAATHIKNWTIELLGSGVPPGQYLQLVTPMITSSPTFSPNVGFGFPYMFSGGLRDKVELAYHTKGRVVNQREAGRSDNNSFVGDVDDRVAAFLSTLPAFELDEWKGGKLNTITVVAKTLARGERIFMTRAMRALAVPLSKQDWIADL